MNLVSINTFLIGNATINRCSIEGIKKGPQYLVAPRIYSKKSFWTRIIDLSTIKLVS